MIISELDFKKNQSIVLNLSVFLFPFSFLSFFPLSLFVSFSFFLSANKEYVNEMESVEGSLKQMGENVRAVQVAAVPGLTKWGQDKLDECQGKWDTLSKQVRKNFSLFALCALMPKIL